jgi:hypothetical protein
LYSFTIRLFRTNFLSFHHTVPFTWWPSSHCVLDINK